MPETTRRGARGEGPSEHLSRALLDGYFAGESSAFDLLARSVPHLAARCPGCAAGLPLAGCEDLGGGALGALVRFILGAARGNDPGADGAWRLEERLTRGRLLAPAGAHDDGAA